jgi:PhoH-like ATPase
LYNNAIKNVTWTDEEIAAFYENKMKFGDMSINQYLFIRNLEGKIIDKKKWNGLEFVSLKWKVIENHRFGKVKPLNAEQEVLWDILQDESITVKQVTGTWGSGKSFCTFVYSVDAIERQKSPYRKIVFVRNNIEVSNTVPIGALPAGANDKLLPFAMPISDILGNTSELFRLIEDGKLELLHLGFARGRSLDDCIIVVDESENLTSEHVALLVSRVGKNSTIIFLGDDQQTDKVVFEKNSGLDRLNSRLFGNKLFACVHLSKSERSDTSALAELLI